MTIAIWDTGATNTVITQTVVDACGLTPTGMTVVHEFSGSKKAETYLVNVYLPNNVMFKNLRVTKGNLPGAGMLIGMDVMSQGDFAVTHAGGNTKFSFRFPSEADIDFVAEHNAAIAPKHRSKRKPKPRNKGGKSRGRNRRRK